MEAEAEAKARCCVFYSFMRAPCHVFSAVIAITVLEFFWQWVELSPYIVYFYLRIRNSWRKV